jgi:RNA polymerase sigma factor (sigma-70 family)
LRLCILHDAAGGVNLAAALGVDEGAIERPEEELAEHGALLLATARLITLDDAEAQDVVQATFEIALKRGHTLRDRGLLRAWLLTIATRQALRHVKRRRLFRSWVPLVHDVAAVGPERDELMVLRTALRGLPPRVRAAIALHYLEGYSVRETAEAMGVSENTIKTQLKNGLARLRRELGDA